MRNALQSKIIPAFLSTIPALFIADLHTYGAPSDPQGETTIQVNGLSYAQLPNDDVTGRNAFNMTEIYEDPSGSGWILVKMEKSGEPMPRWFFGTRFKIFELSTNPKDPVTIDDTTPTADPQSIIYNDGLIYPGKVPSRIDLNYDSWKATISSPLPPNKTNKRNRRIMTRVSYEEMLSVSNRFRSGELKAYGLPELFVPLFVLQLPDTRIIYIEAPDGREPSASTMKAYLLAADLSIPVAMRSELKVVSFNPYKKSGIEISMEGVSLGEFQITIPWPGQFQSFITSNGLMDSTAQAIAAGKTLGVIHLRSMDAKSVAALENFLRSEKTRSIPQNWQRAVTPTTAFFQTPCQVMIEGLKRSDDGGGWLRPPRFSH